MDRKTTARTMCKGSARLSNKGRCNVCGRKFKLADKMRDKLPRHFVTTGEPVS